MTDNRQQVIPMIAYENGLEAMSWLCKAFGFTEKNKMLDKAGKLAHGELACGNSIIMLASPTDDYQSPKHHREVCALTDKWYQTPYIINAVLVYVDDIEVHYRHAKNYGATILSDIETGGPGSRYRAEDLEGHRWMFMERK